MFEGKLYRREIQALLKQIDALTERIRFVERIVGVERTAEEETLERKKRSTRARESYRDGSDTKNSPFNDDP